MLFRVRTAATGLGGGFHKETLWSPDRRAYRADDLGHMDVILAMARYRHPDYQRRRLSLAPLPSSNVVRFPVSDRAPGAGQIDRSGEEKQPEPRWLPGMVKMWFSR